MIGWEISMKEQGMYRVTIACGGTSKGVYITRNQLPSDRNQRDKIILAGKSFYWARTIKVPYLSREESHLLLTEIKKIVG
jgi:hypothetical protein